MSIKTDLIIVPKRVIDLVTLEQFGTMDFDINNFSALIKHVDSGVKLANKAVALSKSIKDLLSSSKPPSNADLEALVVELMSEITDTKLANLELKTQLLALKEAAIEAQAKADQFTRYELWETPAGHTVYRLKEECQDEEPMHYLCPTCKENGIRSILQGHEDAKQCSSCSTGYQFREASSFRATGRQRDPLDGYRL